MQIDDRNILDKFCIDFCKIIEKYTKYIIVSGFVAIASGRVRGTEDIAMIIDKISKEKFSKLHEELIKSGFLCMQSDDPEEIYDLYLKDNISIRYTPKNRLVPQMKIKFTKDALDEYQLERKIKLPLTGLDVWFNSINMNIVFKEEYLKSDKDMEDARHLRIIYEDKVDEKEIEKIKKMIKKLKLK